MPKRVLTGRNVALTPPYFHDGSASTLLEAVQMMARYQLGQELSDEQASDIAVFLNTLTGEAPAAPRVARLHD
jgi:cytochrome c peroxidase